MTWHTLHTCKFCGQDIFLNRNGVWSAFTNGNSRYSSYGIDCQTVSGEIHGHLPQRLA